MRLLKMRKATVARIALAMVWVFAVQVVVAAGVELVRITSPTDGEQVKGDIRVQAQTQVENAAYLIFCVDDTRPHSTNVQPYYYKLDTTHLADGLHSLAVEVHGRTGLIAQSAPVMIEVANGDLVSSPALLADRESAISAQATAPEDASAAAENTAAAPESRAAETQEQVSSAPAVIPAAAAPAAATSDSMPDAAPAEGPTLHVHPAHAVPQRVTIILDGRELAFDNAPAVRDGRAYAGLRHVVEQSGGVVRWISAAKQAIAKRAGAELRVTIGTSQAQLDGRVLDLGAAAQLTNGRTIVPLRTACESLGLTITWAPDARAVHLCSAEAPVRLSMLSPR